MNQQSFPKGTPVQFETRKAGVIKGLVSHVTKTGLIYIHGDDGKSYERVPEKVVVVGEAITDFKVVGGGNEEPQAPAKQFDINKRFKFLASLVRMVMQGHRVSLVITGEGGLGKTFTVKEQLRNSRLGDNDIKWVKGFSTAKGLYNTLYENNGKLIIFDDCDSVLEDQVGKNLLKGALDSYDERIISWIVNNPNAEIPPEFEFTGRIIFISNKSPYKIDNAVLSRSSSVDLTMSTQDKIDRMRRIIDDPKFKPEATLEDKEIALDLLERNKDVCKNLNFRTLIEVIDYKTSGEEDWEELAEYVIYNGF